MYCEFYNFRELPFQVSPDRRFFFAGGPHRKAEAYLTFGLGQGDGFIVITGEIGAGKTTLIQHILAKLAASQRCLTGNIVTTQLDGDSLVHMAAAAFGLPQTHENKALVLCQLERHLQACHRGGQNCLLFVDEVQNLSLSALEELRMLSNFQLDGRGLLQICLVGQPEFRATLGGPRLEQLRQRVISTFHLNPLKPLETRAYIEHRLREVGWQDDPEFTDEAFELIHAATGGVPRTTNLICNRLLFFGCLEELHQIDGDVVREVIDEMRSEGLPALLASGPSGGQVTGGQVTGGQGGRRADAAELIESAAPARQMIAASAAVAEPVPVQPAESETATTAPSQGEGGAGSEPQATGPGTTGSDPTGSDPEGKTKRAAAELARFSRGLNVLREALQKTGTDDR